MGGRGEGGPGGLRGGRGGGQGGEGRGRQASHANLHHTQIHVTCTWHNMTGRLWEHHDHQCYPFLPLILPSLPSAPLAFPCLPLPPLASPCLHPPSVPRKPSVSGNTTASTHKSAKAAAQQPLLPLASSSTHMAPAPAAHRGGGGPAAAARGIRGSIMRRYAEVRGDSGKHELHLQLAFSANAETNSTCPSIIIIIIIKGHSLRRPCLQLATNTQNSKPRPPTTNHLYNINVNNAIRY